MLLGVGAAPLGARQRSRLPAGEGGMFVLNSESQAGAYELDPQQAPFLSSSPILYTYFARFYRYGDELLLNHHTVPRSGHAGPEDIYFSPLKSVQRDDAGILSLHWWTDNEALKARKCRSSLGQPALRSARGRLYDRRRSGALERTHWGAGSFARSVQHRERRHPGGGSDAAWD